MPKRKKKKQTFAHIQSPSEFMKDGRWSLTWYSSELSNTDSPILSKSIDVKKALNVASKQKEKLLLVNHTSCFRESLPPRHEATPMKMLFAYGAVPKDAILLGYVDSQESKEFIEPMLNAGARMLVDNILENPPTEVLASSKAIMYKISPRPLSSSVYLTTLRCDWTGKMPESVVNWVNARYVSSIILKCCFLGRGCPAGVDIKMEIESLAQRQELMEEFIDAIFNGTLSIPSEISEAKLLPWRQHALWEYRSYNRFIQAFKQGEKFRESFGIFPMRYQSDKINKLYGLFDDIEIIIREMLYEYCHGKDNAITDILWTDSNAPNLLHARLDEIGATEFIDAICKGVPLEALIRHRHE